MKVSEAAKLFLEYHKAHSKENSVRAYNLVLTQLLQEFETEDSGRDNHGKDFLLSEPNCGREKAADQTNSLLSLDGIFQLHKEQS